MSPADVKEKALQCSDDKSLFGQVKEGATYFAGCYVGGWAMIIDPIRDSAVNLKNKFDNFGKHESHGKDLDREAAKAERELCDKDPNAKLNLIKAYNASAPELLKINTPSKETLDRKTCASVLATLKGFREQKLDELGNTLMRKEVTGATLTEDEKKFVEYRNSNLKIDGIDVVAIAKQQLKEMDIETDCFNAYYSARITCEAINSAASLALGPAGAALKAVQLAKIAKLAGVANKAEKAVVAERAVASGGGATKTAQVLPKAGSEFKGGVIPKADPAITQSFKDKFGAETGTFYRGIRVPKGGKVEEYYVRSDGLGSMASTRAEDAFHYGKSPAGPTITKLNPDDEIVIMKFDLKPHHIQDDPYGTMEHVFVNPNLNIKSPVIKYKEIRIPAKELDDPEQLEAYLKQLGGQ